MGSLLRIPRLSFPSTTSSTFPSSSSAGTSSWFFVASLSFNLLKRLPVNMYRTVALPFHSWSASWCTFAASHFFYLSFLSLAFCPFLVLFTMQNFFSHRARGIQARTSDGDNGVHRDNGVHKDHCAVRNDFYEWRDVQHQYGHRVSVFFGGRWQSTPVVVC